MAEDVLKDRTYDPQTDIPAKPKGFTRRKILNMAAVAGAVAAGGLIGEALTTPQSADTSKTPYELLIERGIKPTQILLGELKILKGANGAMLNVRTDPNTNAEITEWLNIQKWNGVDIQYSHGF